METVTLPAETAENQETEVVPGETPAGEEPPAPENAEKPEEKKEVQPEEPKKNHNQRRFERILTERAEYKAKSEMYEKMLSQQADPKQNTGEPKRENFETDLDYLAARQDYVVAREVAARTQPRQSESNWADVEEKARSTYPDFDDVIEDARDRGITIPQASADAISSSEVGADIQYYLAKNPAEAKKLWNMPNAVAQIRAIGKIEAAIEAKKNAKPVKVSAAPKPIVPVKTTGGEAEVDPDKMSDKDYWAWRKKQKR